MSCLVREPLAATGTNRQRHPLGIGHAKLFAGVLAEVELGKIAVKVLGIDPLAGRFCPSAKVPAPLCF